MARRIPDIPENVCEDLKELVRLINDRFSRVEPQTLTIVRNAQDSTPADTSGTIAHA